MELRGVRSAGLLCAGLLLLGVPVTATAASAPVTAGARGEDQPTDATVQAALDRAEALARQADGQSAQVRDARGALASAARDSAVALEAYELAARAQADAQTRLSAAETALTAAEQEVAARRSGLARWAREAYLAGGPLGLSPGVRTLLGGGTTDDVGTTRTVLARIGLDRSEQVRALEAALDRRRDAIGGAEQAAALADAAAARAGAASRARNAVLADHKARLADLETQLAATRAAAGAAASTALRLGRAWMPAGRSGLPGPGSADCPGGDVSGYPNGRLPRSGLCPVWGAGAGLLLRADAAAAFARMSSAYAADTGRPLCVEDAYRSYDEQVRVKAERGMWAATPGRSNHGWGTAVDLCGGAESFSSPAFGWLRDHAPLYGWFHPAWAEPGGSLPEPWHWEFAGS